MPRAWRSAGARPFLLALLLVHLPPGRSHRATGPRVSELPPRRGRLQPCPGPPALSAPQVEPRPRAAPPAPLRTAHTPARASPARLLKAGHRLHARSSYTGINLLVFIAEKHGRGGGWQAVLLYCSTCS